MSAKAIPFEWEVVSTENPNLALLRRYYEGIIERYFEKTQVEELSLWEAHCAAEESSTSEFKWSAVIAAVARDRCPFEVENEEETDPQGRLVAGGAAVELYYQSQCALLAFIGIDERFRGKGLFQQMMGRCAATLTSMCLQMRLPPYQAFFLECVQARDEDDTARQTSGTDAVTRQKMYQKVGFEPVEGVDLVHPGRLKGHTYNLAVFVGGGDAIDQQRKRIPVSVVLSFIQDLFSGILAAENNDSDEDYRRYEDSLTADGRQWLLVGPEFWK